MYSLDGSGDWNTKGCSLSTFNQSSNVVGCTCDHLTNFACLVVCDNKNKHIHIILITLLKDISSRLNGNENGTDHELPENLKLGLEITTYIGVVLSLMGLIIFILTYLAFTYDYDKLTMFGI